MTTQLQDLFDVFAAIREGIDKETRDNIIPARRNTVHRYEWMEDVDRCASCFGADLPKWSGGKRSPLRLAVTAARRYVIARDFGEFNEKRADMLWKLSRSTGGAK